MRLTTRRLLLALAPLWGGLSGAFGGGCSGCAPVEDPLARIPVESARLEGLELTRTAAFIGAARGAAELVVVDDEDTQHRFAARMDGSTWGAAIHASAAIRFDEPVPLELEAGTLTARELLGVYEGLVAGVDVGVGVTWRRLENERGVVLSVGGLSFGLGMTPLALESVDLQLEDDPLPR